ncbi:hypothetical protein ACLK29_05220 [Leptospira kirschneri]|uniref:hypothetical protein n=1 Tax=Leptospira kirschneri TaxID=29507 RepID=UPI0002BDACE6|nr:hypothetical protein [Leptospira kirschneri]EMN27671.1 hypothetical protein LEP1GSC065_0114 [Leptospira kirschneri serovar Sokoine str. RM1]
MFVYKLFLVRFSKHSWRLLSIVDRKDRALPRLRFASVTFSVGNVTAFASLRSLALAILYEIQKERSSNQISV